MEDQDSEVIEIIPMEEYDKHKAKARASLSWLLCKAYQDKVPTEFEEPFYGTTEGSWQIKPRLANQLASSELYCQACQTMFGENASQWTGHLSIIQVLSRKGIYAVGCDSVDVTETILMQSAPFKLKAHLALIDALMTAFSREIMSIDRVTQTVRRFATFSASSELPSDTEDAILFWVNKVCVTVQKSLQSAQDTVIEGGETSQKVRIVSSKTPRDSISVPIMEDLLEDMGDGCSVATLISFYCPQTLKIEDVCLKSNVGIADSLYNLRLIRSFCQHHLPFRTWHFNYEDLLYTHQTIKVNVMMMISELYYWFEIKTLPIVSGAGLAPSAEQGQSQSTIAARVPSVPISNVTKQSFQRLKTDTELRSSSTPDIHKMSPTASVTKHTHLLHKRQQQNHTHFQDDQSLKDPRPGVHRANSLTTHDLKTSTGVPRQSVVAWPDPGNTKKDAVQSQTSSNLLANVSIDSDMNASFSSGSIDLGELDSSPRLNTDRSQFEASENHEENTINFSLLHKTNSGFKQKTPFPEHIDIESVNSGVESRAEDVQSYDHDSAFHSPRAGYPEESVHFSPKGGNIEPLIPARLKPAKEKINNHTKEEERDELPKRKTPSPPKVKKVVQIDPHLAVIERSGMCDESTETITPVPDNDMFDTLRNSLIEEENKHIGAPIGTPNKFEAFFVRGSVSDGEEILTHRSDATVAESYTIDNARTPEAARAAGIPVIDEFNLTPRRFSREGSVASSKSSGEYSDHESHKIHIDHKMQETENKVNNNNDNFRKNENDFSDPARFIMQKPVLVSRPPKDNDKSKRVHETNFAQIKQMKQFGNIDNSGFVYMQDDNQRPSLKDTFQKKQEKKVSLQPAQNQRTWQQNAVTGETSSNEAAGSNTASNEAASTELLKIRMKLEEKRKAIERKKHTQEIQHQRIRQRLGKAAFLHVVSKPKDDISTGDFANGSLPARMATSDPELPLATISESSMTSSTTSSASPSLSPIRAPAITLKNPRPLSRNDLQQTIENVRKKWFNEDDMVAPKLSDRRTNESPETYPSHNGEYRENVEPHTGIEEPVNRIPVFDRRSASVERVAGSSPKHVNDEQSVERQFDRHFPQPTAVTKNPQNVEDISSFQQHYERRSVSVERPVGKQNSGQPVVDRRSSSAERVGMDDSSRDAETKHEKSESYDEYNNSIDQLNQSLTDLQGEIMRLSLKQRKPEPRILDQRSRSKSPPHALDMKQKTITESSNMSGVEDERSRSAHPLHSQGRSSSQPRQLVPDYEKDQRIGDYQSQTLPRQQPYHHQGQSFMMQNPVTMAGPAGPVYGTPSHFIPGHNQAGIPPTAQQYGSYIMGPTTQHPLGHVHQPIPAPYQQSPPQVYPGAPSMYPGQPYHTQPLVSPQSQPYSTMYASPTQTQFQAFPPNLTGTYTTAAHQHVQYTPPSSQTMLFEPGNQQTFQQQPPQTGSPIRQPAEQSVQKDTSISVRQKDNVMSKSAISKTRPDKNNESSASEHPDSALESIRKTESVNTSDIKKTECDQTQYESSVIADFARKVDKENKTQHEISLSEPEQSAIAPSETSMVGQQDTSAVGFVIGQDDSSLDQSKEEEMQKKKDKIERMRLKRQEEQERKRQKLDQELTRKREAERIKQEEADRRKSDEKARREQIFKQYLEKKEEDEEGPKREKSKQKSRPKSMFVKAGPGADFTEGYDAAACSSNEDLSARAFTVSTGGNNANASKGSRKVTPKLRKQTMRKAVSCNTLHHNGSGDSQNLAYGGLTHRRPPSPDLYRPRRGQRSNESSEAGSAHGGEYTGPKLFVKPSAKSNRHIITNAISHCCLAGSVNTDQKNKVLEEIAKSSAKHFMILFRDASCGYRGLYGFDPDTEDCFKIVGTGPRAIHNEMVERYFKYNSGAKSFSQVASTKHISVSIDAVSLQNSIWKVNKPPPKGMR